MEPSAIPSNDKSPRRTRVVSTTKFAASSLADSIAVAEAIHKKGGGRASHDQLAAFLGYKSANNGSYLDRVASAKLFGLVEGARGDMTLSDRAEAILMPEYAENVRQHLINAFMAVPLFRAVYEEYHGKELPPPFGMQNALRTRFGITPSRLADAYRSLMDSADTAGLFEVRGSRTQLIIPTMASPKKAPDPETDLETPDATALGGGSNGGGGGRIDPPPKSRQDLQNEYVSTLITILREKGTKGELDADLMERIEKLLEITQ